MDQEQQTGQSRGPGRRDVLKLGAVGAVGVAGVAIPLGQGAQAKAASTLAPSSMPVPYTAAFQRPPVLRPYGEEYDTQGKILLYSITAQEATAELIPGFTSRIWAYNGIFPGPTISIDQGTRAKVRVRNELPATHPMFGHAFETSTHLHGSASLPQFDGYANDITRPGEVKVYEYPDFQSARTLWYHDHAVHHTAKNVYTGLAATYQLHDSYERSQLPQDEFDVPLVISDAMFNADGTLAFNDDNSSGLWGDVIFVNGVAWPQMTVKRRVYRFRVLDASISRSYKLRLSNGARMTVVATDAGMLPVPQPVTSFRQGTAERYEVLIDFTNYPAGTKIDLLNSSNANNVDYLNTNKVMRFVVSDEPFDGTNNLVPTRLDVSPQTADTMGLTTAMSKATTALTVEHNDTTNVWNISGKTWDDVVASGFKLTVANPQINDVQVWTIENKSGGWFHPVHIHLVDFKVIARNTNGGKPFAWERGPKDVVYVGESEKVTLLMRFAVKPGSTGGRYMVHCHNLAHEDHDMMVQFRVGTNDPANDPNDPIAAARPYWDTLPPDYVQYEASYPLGT